MLRRTLIGLAGLAFGLGPAALAGQGSAHDFRFDGIEGEAVRLSDYSGKPVLVVNTASRCGFTYQYDGLQALYDRYRDRGLVVLGVPSDDFGGQELDTEAEVKEFCEVNFAIDFPMTAITHVAGTNAHPFYRYARETLGPANAPRWNFHKYLVDGDGEIVAAFGTNTDPVNRTVTDRIEALLAE